MGKLTLVLSFTILMCFATYHFFPGVQAHASIAGQYPITWMMIAACLYLYVGHRLTGK